MFRGIQIPGLTQQIKASTEIVAESSRNIILVTRYISDIYSWTPVWLVFYFPVLGLINLFVHVLKNPLLPTAQSDIALMDMIAGHFARLEFASSGQLVFSFAREVSTLARQAIKNAQQKKVDGERATNVTLASAQNILQYDQQCLENTELPPSILHDLLPLPQFSDQDIESFNYSQINNFGIDDFDMENWSALVPSFSPGELLDMNEIQGNINLFLAP